MYLSHTALSAVFVRHPRTRQPDSAKSTELNTITLSLLPSKRQGQYLLKNSPFSPENTLSRARRSSVSLLAFSSIDETQSLIWLQEVDRRSTGAQSHQTAIRALHCTRTKSIEQAAATGSA